MTTTTSLLCTGLNYWFVSVMETFHMDEAISDVFLKAQSYLVTDF